MDMATPEHVQIPLEAEQVASIEKTLAASEGPFVSGLHIIPLPGPYTSAVYLTSAICLFTIYHFVSYHVNKKAKERKTKKELNLEDEAKARKVREKKLSWIVTGCASFVMTWGSIPFVWDFLSSGLDVGQIKHRSWLSGGLCACFLAYLAVDCFLGAIHYRKHFALATGWIHHIAYIGLITYVSRKGWGHVFGVAAILELPTCILATNIIFPFTRNDVFFSTVFFLTRILFHIILITSYLSPNGRATGTLTGERAVLPGVFLLGALPMHVVWFVNSIKGQIRRARQRKATLSKVDEQTSKVERLLDDKVAIANSDSEAEKNAQAQPPLFSSLPNPLYYSRRMAGQLYGRSRTGSPAPRPGSPVPRAGSPIPGGAEGDQYRFIPRMRTGAAIGSVRRMGGNLRRRIDSVVAAF